MDVFFDICHEVLPMSLKPVVWSRDHTMTQEIKKLTSLL